MKRWRVPIFPLDKAIAKVIARRSTPMMERALRWTTLLADERVLSGLAFGRWLMARSGTRQLQAETGQILRVVLVTSAVPHVLKHFLAQELPIDAFPSGHAVHMGALAAAIADPSTTRRLCVERRRDDRAHPYRLASTLDE